VPYPTSDWRQKPTDEKNYWLVLYHSKYLK